MSNYFPTRRGMAPRAIVACLLAMALSPAAVATDATAPVRTPIERFFANPQLDGALLSPGGRYLAALSGAPDRRDMLIVVDLQTNTVKAVAGYANADVLDFEWVNDERLLFNVSDKGVGPGGEYLASGLFAVDRDGGNLRQLAARNDARGGTPLGSHVHVKMLPWHTFMLGQRGAQDSDWAYVQSLDYDHKNTLEAINLLHLNTRTGEVRRVPRPGPVAGWLLDNAGEPRLATTSKDGVASIHYRDPASDQWRVLATFNAFTGGDEAFTPLGFGGDGTLYVSMHNGKDTASLYRFDFSTGKVDPEPIVVTAGYDFRGSLLTARGKLLGVRLQTDALSTAWFDPETAALQKKIDALLPGTNNLLSVAARGGSPWVLVRSYSDRQPLTWIVYNTDTGKLSRIGDTYPGIEPARMGRQEPVTYKARDGREIPGLLTLPPGGGKNLPLVMLVHGGPYVRGNVWGWESESQFLASRGYAVLEPAFRGSTGFGQSHYRAGWKQWGLAMQDDIADGARWAIAQGHADPQRICIAGSSYGGYSALMGLVRDADLYRCGINWLGVTDINLLYDGHWTVRSDLREDYRKHGMPTLVGDQVKDAEQLKATSPIEQAARITRPLLMAYGGADRRVPIYHGTRLRDAVTRHNKQVEWVVYQDEGHGWSLPQTRIDFWGRVEKFLDRHIGRGAASQ